jgi:hypothetical protein
MLFLHKWKFNACKFQTFGGVHQKEAKNHSQHHPGWNRNTAARARNQIVLSLRSTLLKKNPTTYFQLAFVSLLVMPFLFSGSPRIHRTSAINVVEAMASYHECEIIDQAIKLAKFSIILSTVHEVNGFSS